MNSRELMLAALHHQVTDRLPFSLRPAPDLEARLKEHLGTDEWESALGQDIRRVGYETDQQPADFSRYLGEIPEEAGVSPWGCATVPGTFMHFQRALPAPMRNLTVSDLDDYPWPQMEPRLEVIRQRVEDVHAAGLAAVAAYVNGSYEMACHLRGRERILMDLVGDPEFAAELMMRIAEIKTRQVMAYAESGVDMIHIGDDVGSQRALIMSPATWRSLLLPPLKRIIAGIRSVRNDVLIAYHSCGHVEPVVAELADAGIDVLQSLQPEANDVHGVMKCHGHRLAFWGTLGSQSTFSHGTPEDVRREVRDRIELVRDRGGLMVAPAHVLEPEVTVENVLAFVDEVTSARESQLQVNA